MCPLCYAATCFKDSENVRKKKKRQNFFLVYRLESPTETENTFLYSSDITKKHRFNLFNIFINGSRIERVLSKFADDTKVIVAVDITEGRDVI